MEIIKVMISSTVNDLKGERDAAVEAFKKFPFVKLIGAQPINNASITSSSSLATRDYAKECDLYILILGMRFGWETPSGKSATEIEFIEAFKDNPTKVLVFLKETSEIVEDKQKEFINRVSDYSKGYWRSSFEYTHQLQQLIENSFLNWLKERAAIGKHLTYIDHFLRIAIQRRPEQNSIVYYRTYQDYVELEYQMFGKTYTLHFDRKDILVNFWGCLATLEASFEKWLSNENN